MQLDTRNCWTLSEALGPLRTTPPAALLSRSLLMQDPQVPSDTVAYEDTAYPALSFEDTPLWDSCGRDLADDTAAQNLQALCEAAVAHSTPGQVADFITEQLPTPRGAWILGCVLHLAHAEDGARFWWQYAAGAGDAAASYCLYLLHLAHGDTHAAAFWHEQTGIDTPTDPPADNGTPAYSLSVDTSIPTVLRILSRLTPAAPRGHTESTVAVMDYVTAAVAAGYTRHPDYEIPLPGPDFAEHLEIILAATQRSARRGRPLATDLPNRRPVEPDTSDHPGEDRAQEPERVLVEVAAAEDESASAFFKEAIAACWETATAERTAREVGQQGARLRYYLDRRPLTEPLQASHTRATQPS
ncbi:DUF6207 family protein [Streptomyces sp. KR55]